VTRLGRCAAGALLALAACRPAPTVAPPTAAAVPPAPTVPPLADQPLDAAAERWVEATLAGLSLPERAAQLVMVRAYGRYEHPRAERRQRLLTEVRDLGAGGLVLFDSDLESIPPLLDALQATARVPLLVAADVERGLAFRVERGTVSLPFAMAVGATRSEAAARFVGEVTARESRAVGIHWALAPVVDVNNNPANPVINVRSFGEDPELVARLSAAFIEGARAGGVLTTAKHFPGHGDTAVDSHLARPVLTVDRARLERVEWPPFRRAIAARVDAVMLGHIAVPALEPSSAPATLSPRLAAELLRREMGFTGLIATDAIDMTGVRPAWTGEAVVKAVLAGADVVLLPAEPRVAVHALVRAVEEGRLPAARLDESVRRLLAIKARFGLDRDRRAPRGALARDVARPEDVARARTVAAASMTLVRNDGEVLPLKPEARLQLLHLVISRDFRDRPVHGLTEAILAERKLPTTTRRLGAELSAATVEKVLAEAARATHVLVSAYVREAGDDGPGGLTSDQGELLRRLARAGHKVVVLSFGSPYLLADLPEVPVYLCAYGANEASQQAAIAALFGEAEVAGKLPVTIPGFAPEGHGLALPRRVQTLVPALPEAAGFRPGAMAEVDRVIEGFLAREAFPGAVVAVGRQGKQVHLRAFGRLASEPRAAAVATDSIYDLASLTKVIATTTMAMILVDEGKLDLDKAVVDYLPGFVGKGKERVTVRQLLSHSGGLEWWAPLHQELRSQKAYVERIQAMDLVYEPGTQSKYTDLGVILLGEILERVAGRSLEGFVLERVFTPLGMAETRYRPPSAWLPRIAPTELDPWRRRLVHGEVHDENAFALGGVAPHAGLFGTAPDLARFAQMLLWGGIYDHQRIVSRRTLEAFTRPAGVPGSTRALGWDTKSPEGSSAGTLFSASSFGHTGFTGTSLWLDPERELFVILLTNRVHPTRENNLIREVRPAVADAVVRGLADPEAGAR
jgi:beta-N-acetylhexosaminidase